jgi:16S rRNA (cytosine1402-N4)-methyltransferase
MNDNYLHQSVLAREAITMLDPRRGEVFIDATVGGGGHALAIAALLAPGGILVGIDRDPAAIETARPKLAAVDGITVHLVRDNFANLAGILKKLDLARIDGALFDLGLSSPQLDRGERGFSYQHDAPLDMRMDPGQSMTAYELLNQTSEAELAGIIRRYGEEPWAGRIAEFIVKQRMQKHISTTWQLVEIIKAAIPAGVRRKGPHPARRTFQAIRIAVNGELDALQAVLADCIDLLKAGGRLAVITFHSLEDRIVKTEFQKRARKCSCPPRLPVCRCGGATVKILTKHPIMAGPVELVDNPRARSAKLRVLTKL